MLVRERPQLRVVPEQLVEAVLDPEPGPDAVRQDRPPRRREPPALGGNADERDPGPVLDRIYRELVAA